MEKPVENAHRAQLQGAMGLLAALAGGLEEGIGVTANTVTYTAGKNLGRQLASEAEQTDTVEEALERLRKVLHERHCLWQYELFTPKGQTEAIVRDAGGEEVMLVFRDCMIRQSLFRFGHVQRGSLCNMMYGFFAGALERILGREANLEIVHAGENACYKRLRVRCAPAGEGAPQ
jgi:predicted hydrocarbon binding protein